MGAVRSARLAPHVIEDAILKLVASVFAAALLAAAALAPAPTQAAAPIDAYGRLPNLEELSLSPGAVRIAFMSPKGAGRELVIQTLTGTVDAVINLGETKVRDLRWADDIHLIITSSSTTTIQGMTSKNEFYTSQIYNVTTRKFAPVLGWSDKRALNVVFGAPRIRRVNGEVIVLAESPMLDSAGSGLFRINLENGNGVLVDPSSPDMAGRVIDRDGKVIARSTYNFRVGVWTLQMADGPAWKTILTERGQLEDGKYQDPPGVIGMGPKPGTVIVEMQKGDVRAFYEVALADGAKTELVVDGVQNGWIVHPDTLRIIGYDVIKGATIEHHFFNPADGAPWMRVARTFKGKIAGITSVTPDMTKVIANTSGPGDSGTLYFIDFATNSASIVGQSYPDIGADSVGKVLFVTYKAADGLEIPAFLTLPPGVTDAKDLPLVVLPHGGPAARDYPGFDWWPQAIASRGYAVLQPQFRGSDGFGDAFLEAGYGQWGRKMQTDVSDGVRYLAAQGMIDPKRVCIIGWSYGGYAAMAGPTIDPGVYRCAVAGAGVADLNRMIAWEKDGSGSRNAPVVRYWKRFMGATAANDPALREISPSTKAAVVSVPFMLIHGRDDTVVPLEQSQIMAKAMDAAGKPYEFVILEGEDHWLSSADTRTAMLKASLAFIEKHNPPN
ncbi:MAG: S9 family peptidase [Caulobacter sp.]|nr:S9 family peptidase [Caulobacter sp.]